MAYTTVEAVAEFLARELTGAQNAQLATLLPAVDAWIDRTTDGPWGVNTPILGETHRWDGPLVRLNRAPIASVQAVRSRSIWPDSEVVTLTTAVDYRILSLADGILVVQHGVSTRNGWVEVDYTPASVLDADVALLATMLAAHWLRLTLSGGASAEGIKRYALGNEVVVEYEAGAAGMTASSGELPDGAETILARLRSRRVVFA